MFKNHPLILALCLFLFSCTSAKISTTNTLQPTDLKPFGRYSFNNTQNLELVSSAVHFGFSFEGTQCQVSVSLPSTGAHNYLQYELDGVYQKKIRIEGNSNAPVVITALRGGMHIVWIYKATEAHTGAIIIHKIAGRNVKPLEEPKAKLIEFIGNSITCGAASDASEIPCSQGEYHDHHNAYMAYGPRVARALKTNYIVSSVSGIGIYRNWNSDAPTMPQVYEKTDFQRNSSQLWDFSKYTPDVVSIALGTNDFSHGDGVRPRLPFDSAAFVSMYIKFVQLVKSRYPKAQIALLSSPMIRGGDRIVLQNCLKAVKQNIDSLNATDKRVALYFFEPMTPRGCAGHPSVEDHAILAEGLVPFFQKLL
jgi:lysophospholipase L1-like esterase